MIKTFFTLAYRNIIKHKLFSFINIMGLSIGLTAAIVLFLFARYQLSYDQFHAHQKDTYIVYKERLTPTGVQPTYDTWYPLLGQLKADFPEVRTGTRIAEADVLVEIDGNRFNESCYLVDPQYFNVFDFPLTAGDNNNPLPTKQSVILSKALSKKYFGNEDAIGQTLIVNFDQQFVVSGVLEDYPRNSFISSELIFPITSHPYYQELENNWNASSIYTAIQLEPSASPEVLTAKFPELIKKLWDEEVQQRTNFKLLPLKATFETFVGDPKDVYILVIVGIGLILIVTINFVNLSTARTLDRSKEVSMRKVFGAKKGQLIHQFLYESIIMSLVSLSTSILATKLLLPFVNQRFELDLNLDLAKLNTWLVLLFSGIMLGLLAGSIPSAILSGLQIQRGLKSFKEDRAQLRNILVTFQFGLSMVLLIGVTVIGKQVTFMKNADLGFQVSNQIVIPISVNDFENADEATQRLQSFKDIISKHSSVKSLTSSRHIPFNWSGSNLFVKPEGWQDEPLRMRYTYHDADFFKTYNIQLLDGPGFKDDSFGDQRESVVINEAALRAFGWDNIKDKTLLIGDYPLQVVGLIRDFNYETLQVEVAPILHFHRAPSNRTHQYITINVVGGNGNEVIDFIKSKWSLLSESENLPFNYFYLDSTIDQVYQSENRLFTMIKLFAVIIVIVACLGLYGLSSFTLDKKKKEIGIRKVLGASIPGIVTMFFKKYLTLLTVSFIISAPVSWYLMNEWLSGYASHTMLTVSTFVMSFISIIIIALAAISLKTFQVASMNPAVTIKEDS